MRLQLRVTLPMLAPGPQSRPPEQGPELGPAQQQEPAQAQVLQEAARVWPPPQAEPRARLRLDAKLPELAPDPQSRPEERESSPAPEQELGQRGRVRALPLLARGRERRGSFSLAQRLQSLSLVFG